MIKKRDFILGGAAALAAPAVSRAQSNWPQRPIMVVVPYGPGGSGDFVARLFAQKFQMLTGGEVVIENKNGASGGIATQYVAKAAPDGYTLLLGTASTHAINPTLYPKQPFNVETDFEPISPFVRLPNILVVNNDVPVKSVPELVAYMKANDGKLNYGSGGIGTSSHLSVVMLMQAVGATMVHIPYHATSDELTAMIGGHIQLAIDGMTSIWPIAKAGEVRALGVSSAHRVAAAPDLPTIGETIPGYEAVGWQGLFAPRGTPRPIIDKLAAYAKQIFTQPETVKALQDVGGEAFTLSPDAFAAFTKAERVKWAKTIKDANIHVE